MGLPPPYYAQAGITIYHGDNVEIMRQMESESIDLVVTSPPYDNLRTYGGHSWDFPAVAEQLARLIKPGGVIVWIVADAMVDESETGSSMRQALHFKDDWGLNLHDTMIYRKTSGGANGSTLAYLQCWEFCFVLSRGRPKSINLLRDRKNIKPASSVVENPGRRHADGIKKNDRVINRAEYGVRWNVWDYTVGAGHVSEETYAAEHPAIFPESLARDHILSWSNPGDVVLDPFNGSGTTTKMAKRIGRCAIGIEIEEKYCNIATDRLQIASTLYSPKRKSLFNV